MWSIGRARAACQRSIDSGKSDPQVRKLWITAGCLRMTRLNSPKSAESPVSETPKKTLSPRGCSVPALALAATAKQARAAASMQTTKAFSPWA